MNQNSGSNGFQVAPHGIIMLGALALLLILAIHMLGFRIVGAIKVGK